MDRNLRRERLRWQIARAWRRAGRTWTTAEIDAAVDAELARREAATTAPEPAPQPPEPPPVQQTLIDADDATAATRADAHRRASRSRSRRCDDVELWVAAAGRHGMTRDEIAARGIPLQSVCSVVRDLVRAGRLVHTRRTRPTRTGSPATVIVSAMLAKEDAG